MAVYDRTYRRYQGPVTSQTWRFLVVSHYVLKDVFKSKLLVFFYALCFVYPLVLGVSIYLRNNLDRLGQILPQEALEQFQVDAGTFAGFLYSQGFLAFFLTVVIGPRLISRDLANNGLPLYLSRPISRAQYVLGKLSVIFILLSGITWVPGLMLFALQSALDKGDWMTRHLRVAAGMTLGSWVWILLLAVIALALSAWVKWRPVAAFLMFMIFASGSFFALILNLLFFGGARERAWGYLVDPGRLIVIVWSGLLGTEPPDGPPVALAWIALAAMTAFLLWVLNRKLRAYEVVT
ncbi:MAG TPA: ABC transporter permease [Thermoanaerobaculia bacterium]|jgi:ABC-2 type transport system permease protein